jgi:predicted DNA-binding WGR domain protein
MDNNIFFNINPGHFKVWFYDYDKSKQLLKTWRGQIGSKLREMQKLFPDKTDAEKYIDMKVREKLEYKGYSSMPKNEFFRALDQPRSELFRVMEQYQ